MYVCVCVVRTPLDYGFDLSIYSIKLVSFLLFLSLYMLRFCAFVFHVLFLFFCSAYSALTVRAGFYRFASKLKHISVELKHNG